MSGLKKSHNKGFNGMLSVTVYLLLAAVLCALVTRLCTVTPVVVKTDQPGLTDLTDFDFENSIAQVATESTQSIYIYAGAFYTSEDFAAGNVPIQGVLYDRTEGAQGDYGTLRMELRMPPGEVYAIAAKNPSYAQRLFIDGKEYTAIGVPGNSAETVVPKTARFVEAFMPQGETTEIIFHYSNFVHADGGGLYPMDIGTVTSIVRNEQLTTIRTTAVAAALIAIMLFFFGLFLFFKRYKYLLWFSLLCGCIALRVVGSGLLTLLLPGLSWYLEIRLSYIETCLMALFAALYITSLFPGVVNKWAVRGFTLFCGGCVLFISLAPTTVFTRYPVELSLAYMGFVVYLLLMVLWRFLRGTLTFALSKSERRLLLIGLLLFALLSAADIFAHQRALLLFGLSYQAVGMVVFLFINMLALVMSFSRTEQELFTVRESQREIQATNRMLERLNHIRTAFLQNVTHEMKTPLTGINVLSQYVKLRLMRDGSLDDETGGSLDDIVDRTGRLSEYVDRLLEVSVAQDGRLDFAVLDIGGLFGQAQAQAAPLLRERGNRLSIRIGQDLPPLAGAEEMLVQVFLNLIVNANRHSRDSEILLSAAAKDGMAEIRVTDQGGGIPAALLPRVFERGVSGDGSTGLGLANCKEIVETHGGLIRIDSDEGCGTQVWFTVPFAKEEDT